MMTGQNIICFAKDWREDPTSNNHVMKLLARDNRVLWINSIATRTPSVTSGRDLSKMVAKLGRFARGLDRVDDNLWVFTPIVLPFPHSSIARVANRQIVKQTIRALRFRLDMDQFQLWSFLPTAEPYFGSLGESIAVYYITDEFSQFSELDSENIARMERDLCERADVVFVTANTLLETKRRYNPQTHLASHGVDHAHFSRALDESITVPAEVAGLSPPVLGFFGLIHDWVDLATIAHLATERPDWSIVLIGKATVDTSALDSLPNVRMLGRKPYEHLPAYCRAFDVALIPFVVNELTHHVNPIKLREYLSAGLPVVSSPLPEVTHYSDTCYLADGADEFLRACERALDEDSDSARKRRCEAMAKETWEQKVGQLGDHVMRVSHSKG